MTRDEILRRLDEIIERMERWVYFRGADEIIEDLKKVRDAL